MSVYDDLRAAIDKIIADYKAANVDGSLSFREIFTLSSNAIASFVRLAEAHGGGNGADKKAAVLAAIDQFFDEVIAPIDIRGIPNFLEPVADTAMKNLVLTLADSWVDSLVNLFNKTGWGETPEVNEDAEGGDTPQGFFPY